MAGNLEKSLFDMIGDPRELESGLEDFRRNVIYFERNEYGKLQEYKGKWVAIVNETVFAHHSRQKEVLRLMKEAGIDFKSVYVQYVDKEPRTLILNNTLLALPIGV